MVIAPGNSGITAHVILADDEALPLNLNTERTVVYRRGDSTNRELELVKGLGVVLQPGDPNLRDKSKPVCNYDGGGNPLHEHEDKTWWFYEETWAYENGPFPDYDQAYNALAEYCVGLETARQIAAEVNAETEDKNVAISEEVPTVENEDRVGGTDSGGTDLPGASDSVADGVED